MATKMINISRPQLDDENLIEIHTKVTKLGENRYRASAVFNGKTITAEGHSEGVAGDLLRQKVEDAHVRGHFADGAIN
jgi:hypothetical protein